MYASDEELASWLARPEWPVIRATLLLRGHYDFIAEMDALIERVRREVWKDFSGSQVREG